MLSIKALSASTLSVVTSDLYVDNSVILGITSPHSTLISNKIVFSGKTNSLIACDNVPKVTHCSALAFVNNLALTTALEITALF